MKKVEIFHIGPQKSSTTWQYKCFQEHPELGTTKSDSVHYFDIHFAKGETWYESHFSQKDQDLKMVDMTPSYLRNLCAAERIHEYNPKAKIMVCLREPIERGFSHLWHSKKKNEFNYTFEQALTKYDLYSNWIESGFYARHLERYISLFGRDALYAQRFEDLATSPKEFIQNSFDFMGVDASFEPSFLERKVNVARPRATTLETQIMDAATKYRFYTPALKTCTLLKKVGVLDSGTMETLSDVPQDVIDQFLDICEPETKRLEALLDIDLSSWRDVKGAA